MNGCLLCHVPAMPKAWLCARCHRRILSEAAISVIEDALREARAA